MNKNMNPSTTSDNTTAVYVTDTNGNRRPAVMVNGQAMNRPIRVTLAKVTEENVFLAAYASVVVHPLNLTIA